MDSFGELYVGGFGVGDLFFDVGDLGVEFLDLVLFDEVETFGDSGDFYIFVFNQFPGLP